MTKPLEPPVAEKTKKTNHARPLGVNELGLPAEIVEALEREGLGTAQKLAECLPGWLLYLARRHCFEAKVVAEALQRYGLWPSEADNDATSWR